VTLAEFAAMATAPAAGRRTAARAVLDTVGVMLAGASEAAARSVQHVIAQEAGGSLCSVVGTTLRSGASSAALANGTAAHAHDYDDMCFVSLAHPSAPLVAAALAVAEREGCSGRALLDAYVVGFEIEARLGRAMNPRHYERGWHCTSTLGTIGAAAAASRLLQLDCAQTGHALAIAASQASGLKANFGTMVKPLHAGLAARNGVLAALLAADGMTASRDAIDGPQGFLAAMDSASPTLDRFTADLGDRWEILDTGITIKLYPSCAATHPALDALLELKRRERFVAGDIARVDIGVDAITPTVLLYENPSTALEGKFSMPFCAAAALVHGQVGLDTFTQEGLAGADVSAVRGRITMGVDPTLDSGAPPLTQARIRVALNDGRVLTANADGARGYPDRPASDEELAAKFRSCARIALSPERARSALMAWQAIDETADIRTIIGSVRLQPDRT
jgi:2-methylcitrate dehydratase PrpD